MFAPALLIAGPLIVMPRSALPGNVFIQSAETGPSASALFVNIVPPAVPVGTFTTNTIFAVHPIGIVPPVQIVEPLAPALAVVGPSLRTLNSWALTIGLKAQRAPKPSRPARRAR